MIRKEVAELVALGSIPGIQADESEISAFEQALQRISAPLTNEEAVALIASFGQGDCYGLAWTLVHLIESAPGPAAPTDPGPQANEWVRILWERAQ